MHVVIAAIGHSPVNLLLAAAACLAVAAVPVVLKRAARTGDSRPRALRGTDLSYIRRRGIGLVSRG